MSKVQINNVVVLNNPATFQSPFQFEITFDCMENLEDDLEWKLTYVGSAESSNHDQILDTIYVGPVPEGRHMFVFQADGADHTKIPPKDILGVTAVMITCSYHQQEFVRVGYFVHNDYESEELKEKEKENPSPAPDMSQTISRSIMAEEPRVTRFRINWGDGPAVETPHVVEEEEGGEVGLAGAEVGGLVVHDTESMLEPLPSSSFNDVHSMEENSNVEMEMAF